MNDPIAIYNGVNPCGSGIDIGGDPRIADWLRDRAPRRAQQLVYLSRADCSTLGPISLSDMESDAFDDSERARPRACAPRSATGNILNSFCPIKAVTTLVNRGLPRDYNGYIVFDHELPAWRSCLHRMVYDQLQGAIKSAFPHAAVLEYAGVYCDWVLGYSKPDRSHELAAMDGVAKLPTVHPLPAIYVPDAAYIADLVEFRRRVNANLERWMLMRSYGKPHVIITSPHIETKGEPDYSKWPTVPVEAMAVIVDEADEAGCDLAVWSGYTNAEQAERVLQAWENCIIPAVERCEKEAQ